MAPSTANTGDTTTIIIADRNYSITKLQGQQDYQVWRIQMQDMFEDVEVMKIIDGTTARPTSTADAADWDKKNKAALGALRRRVDTGPMTHVARCTTAADAWSILQNQYQSLGIAAMTLLRNRFTSLRMNEADNLEEHIKELRKIFNDLNIALMSESSEPHKEIEFTRQLLASLPESWQILVSVIPQRPESNDKDGTKLSADIQSRLLAEYHRRESQIAEKAFYANNRRIPNRSSNYSNRSSNYSNRPNNSFDRSDNSNFNPTDRSTIICHNCGISGHIRRVCRKPGGGAYKGKNRQYERDQDWRNENQENSDQDDQDNTFDDENRSHNDRNRTQRVHFASSSEFAYSFARVDHQIDLNTQDFAPSLPSSLPTLSSFDSTPDLSINSCHTDIITESSPDPMSFDIYPPISDFEEPEVPVLVSAPSEGEIDVVSHTSVETLIADTFTRHEDSLETVITAQGEQFPMPALTLDRPVTTSELVPIETNASFSNILACLLGYILLWSICYRFSDIILAVLLLIHISEGYIVPHIRTLKRTLVDSIHTAHPSITFSSIISFYNVPKSIIVRLFKRFSPTSISFNQGDPLVLETVPDDNSFDIHGLFELFDRIYKSLLDYFVAHDYSICIDICRRYIIKLHTRIKPSDLTADLIRLVIPIDSNFLSFIEKDVKLVDRLKIHIADILA